MSKESNENEKDEINKIDQVNKIKNYVTRKNIVGGIIIGVLLIMSIFNLIKSDIPDRFSNLIISISTSDPRERAIKVARKKFENLGEKNINKKDLTVVNINSNNIKTYYISSKENSIQISKDNLKILRINNKKI